jgi:pilus assembly protein CpaB
MVNLSKIIAAILVVIAILLGVYAWMLGRKPPPSPAATSTSVSVNEAPKKTYPVVFTSKTVPAGQPIPADALVIQQLPVDPPDALKDLATATDRIPVFDLGPGSPVLESQLVSGLALRIEEGERAIAIKADEVMGVGNKIRPGDYVDVFFTLKTDGREIDQSQARLLLARRRVLAFGSSSVDGVPSTVADGQNGRSQQQQQRGEPARTAVLAVPVDEVNRLIVGDNSGRLLLALRNPSDASVPDAALFAELPTTLKTLPQKPGEATRAPLGAIDKAMAGLAVTDLATGGDKSSRNPIKPMTEARVAAARSSAAGSIRPRTGNEVEIIRGDKREMLSY